MEVYVYELALDDQSTKVGLIAKFNLLIVQLSTHLIMFQPLSPLKTLPV